MTSRSPSLLNRALRRTGILLTTAATAALAIGLVVVGSNVIAARAVSVEVDNAAPPVPVRTTRLEIQPGYAVARQFLGQIEPRQETAIAFERGGTVLEVLADEGDTVEAGQLLARLDTRSLIAERASQVAARDALVAQAELARLTAGRQQALEAKGWAATQAFDQARLGVAALEAQIAQAEAGIAATDVALDKAEIRAPFAGRIGARLADQGATVAGGSPVLRLLEARAPQMRVGLPPELAQGLAPGTLLTAEVAGLPYPATVAAIRGDLDSATRTQAVLLDLRTGNRPAPFGQTGSVTLERQVPLPGAWLPLGALREGERGLWTVLTVENGTVGQEAVEVIHTEDARVFVRGTFRDGADIIDAGVHRVIPGQAVALAGN